MLQPAVRPLLPRRIRRVVPRRAHPFARLPRETAPPPGVTERGTVALLSGCAQDRWFHEVNRATIRVLAATGWRVTVPRGQACCGALAAHNGRLAVADRLRARAASAFRGADTVVVNAAGCSAHLQEGPLPAVDLLRFLAREGPGEATFGEVERTVAYHDACHAVRAQGIAAEPREVLGWVPGLRVVDVPGGDRCCGAAGIYNVTQPVLADELQAQKAAGIRGHGGLDRGEREPRLLDADRRRPGGGRRAGRRGGASGRAARPGPGHQRESVALTRASSAVHRVPLP